MPTIRRYLICLMLLSNWSISQAEMTVVEKQEEVLLRLANEGSEESYKVLAQFYADRSSSRNKYFNKSVKWRITAASHGDINSIYVLGYYGLRYAQLKNALKGVYVDSKKAKDIWLNEALIMISEAAILGKSYARIDLVMLPKLLRITTHSLEEAFNEAFKRLIKGQPVNCEFFNCDEQFQAQDTAFPLLQYRNDIKIYLDEKYYFDCKKFSQCFLSMAERIERIDQASEQQYQRSIMNNNLKIMNKYNSRKNKYGDLSDKSWDEIANIDRNQQRLQAARTVVSQYSAEDRKKLQDKINELLNAINNYREEPNKIKPSEVIDMLSQP